MDKRAPSVRPPSRAVQPPSDGRPKNRLLAALPAQDFERLRPHLTTIPVRAKQVLHKQGETIEHVFFPNGGVCSVTTVLSSGATVEAATVGDEGLLGIEAFLAADAIAPGETIMQVPDTNAEMLAVSEFRRALAEPGPFRELIGRYTQVVIAQMMQSAACNVLHQVQQRCARWLLMTHDRMHERDLYLSHGFLAVMLGVQRPTVSAVAGTLQDAGLIRYKHGRGTRLTIGRGPGRGRHSRRPCFGNQQLAVVERQIEDIAHTTLREVDSVHAFRKAPG